MFELKEQAKITNVSFNRERAGEDAGSPALVLNLQSRIGADVLLPLLKGDHTTEKVEAFYFDGNNPRFSGMVSIKLSTQLKDCCRVTLSTDSEHSHTEEGATVQKFTAKPSDHKLFEMNYQIYIPEARDDLVTWAYHNQNEVVDVFVEQIQADFIDGESHESQEAA